MTCFGPQTTLPDYGRIVYDSKQELLDKVKRFLADEDERKQIAAEMRQTVIERFSYRSGMQHVLQMMRRVLSGESEVEHLERS